MRRMYLSAGAGPVCGAGSRPDSLACQGRNQTVSQPARALPVPPHHFARLSTVEERAALRLRQLHHDEVCRGGCGGAQWQAHVRGRRGADHGAQAASPTLARQPTPCPAAHRQLVSSVCVHGICSGSWNRSRLPHRRSSSRTPWPSQSKRMFGSLNSQPGGPRSSWAVCRKSAQTSSYAPSSSSSAK